MIIALFGRGWLKPCIAQFIIEVPIHLANLALHSRKVGWPLVGQQLSFRRFSEGGAEQMHASIMQGSRAAGGGGSGSRKRRREDEDTPLAALLRGQDKHGKSLNTALRIMKHTIVQGEFARKGFGFSDPGLSSSSPCVSLDAPLTSIRA